MDEIQQALALLERAAASFQAGNVDHAISAWKEALQTLRATEIQVHRRLALALEKMGQFSQAVEHLEAALAMAQEREDQITGLELSWTKGQVLEASGELPRALTWYHDTVRPLAAALGRDRDVARAYRNMAACAANLGFWERVRDYSQAALQLDEQAGDQTAVAEDFKHLARALSLEGSLDEAVGYVRRALNIHHELGDETAQADDHRTLAGLHQKRGDFSAALEAYHQAIRLDEKAGNKRTLAEDYRDLGMLHEDLEETSEALTWYEKAMSIYQELDYPEGQAGVHFKQHALLKQLGRDDEATQELHSARELLDQVSGTIGGVMEAAISMMSPAGVGALVGQHLRKFWVPEITWQLPYLVGLQAEQQDPKEAVKQYQACLDYIERSRSQVEDAEWRMFFVENKRDVYDRLIRLFLDGYGTPQEAFHTVERAKSRAFLDLLGTRMLTLREEQDAALYDKHITLLKRTEHLQRQLTATLPMEDATAGQRARELLTRAEEEHQALIQGIQDAHPQLASLITVSPLTAEEVQASLDQDTTLLEYYLMENSLVIFVLTSSSLHCERRPLPEGGVAGPVSSFREALQDENTEAYRDLARKFHELLIRPVSPFLQTRRVGVVPHGLLHYLPFAALWDGTRFLLEDFTLFYLPSASVWPFCQGKRGAADDSLLALGNPNLGHNIWDLPYAEEEIKAILPPFTEAQPLFREQATETNVRKLADRYQVVHFACHGKFYEEAPLRSALRLAKDDQYDGNLEVSELFGLDLAQASLVTLSACTTGLSEVTQGDELIGLVRGFIYAGAPSVVATLWNISDWSTSFLAEKFYELLKTAAMGSVSRDKAWALQQAQRYLKDLTAGQAIEVLERRLATIGHQADAEVQRARLERLRNRLLDKTDGDINKCIFPHPYYWAPFLLVGDWQ